MRRGPLAVALIGAGALIVGLGIEGQPSAATSRDGEPAATPVVVASIAKSGDAAGADAVAAGPQSTTRHLELGTGDSLYALFERSHLSLASLARLMTSDPLARRLHDLRPGCRIDVDADAHGHVLAMRLTPAAGGPGLEFTRAAVDLPFAAREIAPGEVRVPPAVATANTAGTAATAERAPEAAPEHRLEEEVRRGDSLSTIFQRAGVPARELALLTGGPEGKSLRHIRPGDRVALMVDASGERLLGFDYQPDALRTLHFARDGDTFHAGWSEKQLEVRTATASGAIEQSLFVAGQRAGLSDSLIMELAEIFGWDIDFALEIREGDRFSLLYEERFDENGNRVSEGPILAAEFVNQGHRYRAVRYVLPNGRAEYYTPEGLSMRKAFLRTPVNFTRISSRFSSRRKHPILHRIRAHRGVDYAAPRGTPIKAAGDGKVVFAGRKGGYGNTVVLRHGSVYTTLYAHMWKFARGIRAGRTVRQGQVIGYVGRSGLATGTHLHYEFRVRGVHHDPLKVKLPKAAPIARKLRADFLARAGDLLARLDARTATRVAERRD